MKCVPHFTKGQVVLIVLLVGTFELFFGLWVLRTEGTSDPNVFTSYWGFPFEAIKIQSTVRTGSWVDVGELVSVRQTHEYLWGGIIVNLLIYIVFSTIIVKSATWIREEIEYRRYYSL